MRLDSIQVVAKREYLQRVKTKGFWIGTLILPLFALAMTVLPAVLISKSRSTQTTVVVDETGKIGKELLLEAGKPDALPVPTAGAKGKAKPPRLAQFVFELAEPARDQAAQRAELNRRVLAKEIDAWVWIGPGVLQGERVEYHARNVSNFITQEVLEDDLSTVVRRARLREAGLDPERVGELTKSVQLATQKVSEEGSRGQGGLGGLIFAVVLFFILYIAVLMWGQQIMNGVLEEKGSRVIEVVLSAIKPFDLMMGKLVGICLVGLTQLAIWLGTMAVATAPGLVAALAVVPEGTAIPTLTPAMAFHFGLLFILGFFAFATLYAAIGASFNNLQEAQQAASVAIVFIIVPALVLHPVINDPNSTLAVVLSLIPVFTPLLMPLRIAIEMPPLWQLLLAYALTLGFVVGMVWLCARIYRVGILMYGKKPTFQEIWRWVRYA